MNQQEIAKWASAYIEAQMLPELKADHPLWWAVYRFMPGADTDATPEDCWLAILEVLSRKPPEQVLGILGAGALEDLIAYHGPQFIERIESEARRNIAFRHLLGRVWQNATDSETWERVKSARID
jgi:hypothetical protein